MGEIPQDVRALAAGIADDIERNGHYQGDSPHWWAWSSGENGPNKPCCLIYSPTGYSHFVWYDRPWQKLRGLIAADSCEVSNWNDETPTPEVLAMLRKIAAGEQP